MTYNTFVVDEGTVTTPAGAGGNSLSDDKKAWQNGVHKNRAVRILSGQGAGQVAFVQDNSRDSMIIRGGWLKPIAAGDTYAIMNADFMQMLRDVFGGGSDINAGNPLQVYDPKVFGALSSLVLVGTVTSVPAANKFTIPTLAGQGANKFIGANPWWVSVLWKGTGTGGAPQGEQQQVTAYDTATGTFTTNAFTVAVAANDVIAILHPDLVNTPVKTKATTIDLNQAAGTYDLFTGMLQPVIVDKLIIRMSGGAAGGALTSISIQTDDVTPQTFITNVQGGIGNLTDENQLFSTDPIYLAVGKKIQLTINGGATGAATVCDVIAESRAVVSGGYLA